MPVAKRHHLSRGSAASKSVPQPQPQPVLHDDKPDNKLPQHPFMPDLPQAQGELFLECILFLYSVIALGLQYLNLFKTTWWLPHSFTHYIIKIHLIDPYLLSCVGLMLGRKVIWCFLKKTSLVSEWVLEEVGYSVRVLDMCFKCVMLCAVLTSFMFSFVRVLSSNSIAILSFLFYPVLVYIFLYWNQLVEAYRMGPKNGWKHWTADSDVYSGCNIKHRCSTSPALIREEADAFIMDLSCRLKKSLFSALTAAYFSIFIPFVFSPATLYVDLWWVCEMFVIVVMTSLSLFLAYLLPLQYCDVLHQCVSHLGAWEPVPGRNNASQWQEDVVWTEGDVVQYDNVCYEAVGQWVCAIPGVPEHARLVQLSRQPMRMLNLLCVMETGLIVVQFLMLVHSREWQHIVTIVFFMFVNYLLLFKVFKEQVVLTRVYHPSPQDSSVIRKFNLASNSKVH